MTVREKLYKVIFESDTKAGKWFDIVLLYLISFSVIVVTIESIPVYGKAYAGLFFQIDILLTIVFTIEYVLRILVSRNPVKYVSSFWGIIDLISVLPMYLSLAFAGYHYLLVVRIFRLLRIFRILRLVRFHKEAATVIAALKNSYYKITVFLLAVFFLTIILGTLMYVVEGGEGGFTSIPQSIYWAIVTITTVGYGDMVPTTAFGKVVSSVIMLLGYAIFAVPTGIVTLALSKNAKNAFCSHCEHINPSEANFCNQCSRQIVSSNQAHSKDAGENEDS